MQLAVRVATEVVQIQRDETPPIPPANEMVLVPEETIDASDMRYQDQSGGTGEASTSKPSATSLLATVLSVKKKLRTKKLTIVQVLGPRPSRSRQMSTSKHPKYCLKLPCPGLLILRLTNLTFNSIYYVPQCRHPIIERKANEEEAMVDTNNVLPRRRERVKVSSTRKTNRLRVQQWRLAQKEKTKPTTKVLEPLLMPSDDDSGSESTDGYLMEGKTGENVVTTR